MTIFVGFTVYTLRFLFYLVKDCLNFLEWYDVIHYYTIMVENGCDKYMILFKFNLAPSFKTIHTACPFMYLGDH